MRSLLLYAVLTGAGTAAPEPIQDVEARADALVREGKLDEAFAMLERAYYAEPNPEPRLLFGLGIIELERGNCEAAVGFLGRFLATSPGEGAVTKTREVIAYCEAELRGTSEPAAADEPPVEPPGPTAPGSAANPLGEEPADEDPAGGDPRDENPATERRRPRRPNAWYRDGLGWGLLGTGLAATAAGAGLLGQARSDLQAARSRDDEASFARSVRRIPTLRAVGGALTGVGGGLLIGAAIRYGVVARRARSAPSTVWIAPASGGVSVGLHRRF